MAKRKFSSVRKPKKKIEKSKMQQFGSGSNRKYKDSMFTDLFYSDITAEENLRSLYNALHPEDPLVAEDPIKKIRLENVFFNTLQNDIASIFKTKILFLGEHQSTINNNIPARMLMYVGQIYEQLLSGHEKYETELIKIPTPEFYVFYNGKADWDVKELKLSDAFSIGSEKTNLELKVVLINIRSEKNHEVLQRCPILDQYSKFVQAYEFFKGSSDRMGDTIRYCVEHDILTEYIQRKGKEVIGMMTAEWDEVEARKVAREEGKREGRREGERIGETKSIVSFYKAGVPVKLIVQATGKSEEEITRLLKNNGIL